MPDELTITLVKTPPSEALRMPAGYDYSDFMLEDPVPATPGPVLEDDEDDADLTGAIQAETRASEQGVSPIAWDEAKRRFGL